MSHIIELMQLPPGIRSVYTIPLVWCYVAEKFVPGQLLKKVCSKGRVFFKCLSYGATDLEAQELMEKLPGAPCLADYEAWTTRLDIVQDHESWKESDETVEPEFDPELIRERIRAMYDALYWEDHEQMRLALQQSINRKLGGMDLPRLYKHCWFGTKHLIDDYVNAVRGTIEAYVAFLERPETPVEEVRRGKAVLENALGSYGQTALCLSGGATLGIKHVGVVKCLWESFLLPRVLCGTSAGSIVASVVATTTDEDMRDVLERFQRSRLAVFYADNQGRMWNWVWDRLLVLRKMSAFYDPSFLNDVLYDWLQDMTFQEAYNKTRRILNVAVSRLENTEPTVLNYITAPDVVIRTAVTASCAVPWIYPAARILEKKAWSKELVPWKGDAGQMYVDGSLDHDVPTRVLGATWNAKYFIVSQVNPHVRWFLSPEEEFLGMPITTPYHYAGLVHSAKVTVLQVLNGLIDSVELVPVISDLSVWRYGSLLAQQYTGDVNIYPSIDLLDCFRILANPTPEYVVQSMMLGERATWPKMPRIKNCLAIEEALRKAISDLIERLSLAPMADKERRRKARESRPRTEARQPEFLKRRSLSTGWVSSRRGSSDSSPGHARTKSDPVFEEKRAQRRPSSGYEALRRASTSSVGSVLSKDYSATVMAQTAPPREVSTSRPHSGDDAAQREVDGDVHGLRDRAASIESVSPKTIPRPPPLRHTASALSQASSPAGSAVARSSAPPYASPPQPHAPYQTPGQPPTPLDGARLESVRTPQSTHSSLPAQPSPLVKKEAEAQVGLKRNASFVSSTPPSVMPAKKRLKREGVPIWARNARSANCKPIRFDIRPPDIRPPDIRPTTRPERASTTSKWEESIINKIPHEDLIKHVCDWIYLQIGHRQPPPAAAFEIEAKIGNIIDVRDHTRIRLPILSEAIFEREAYWNPTKFESTMDIHQHRHLNSFLNDLTQTSFREAHTTNPSRDCIRAAHTVEVDEFLELNQQGARELGPGFDEYTPPNGRAWKVRRTTNKRTGEQVACIIKTRIADLEVFCPNCAFDYRISVNVEANWKGNPAHLIPVTSDTRAGGGRLEDRAKDRVSYRHLAYQIDLTQISHSNSDRKEHELEVEISVDEMRREIDKLLRTQRGEAAGDGGERYERLVRGFINNVRVLCREGSRV
ncbi:hypothetical protein DV736_g4095, partial [Chaetothyriales sp. CBS 134916]